MTQYKILTQRSFVQSARGKFDKVQTLSVSKVQSSFDSSRRGNRVGMTSIGVILNLYRRGILGTKNSFE